MNVQVELTPTECAQCGTPFAISASMLKSLRETGGSFYCPNGHSLSFGKGENEKLKKQINNQADSMRSQREEVERLNKVTSALKGQITKLKKKKEEN